MPKTAEIASIVPEQSQSEIRRRVEKEILGGDSYSTEGLIYRMQHTLANMLNDKIDLGRCALAIKEMVGHGAFVKIMNENLVSSGLISLDTINRSMKLAKFMLAHGGGKINFLSDLPRMKQLMLAGAPDDQVDEEAGTIFGLSEQDLKAIRINELRDQIEKLTGKVATQKEELARGREQLTIAKDRADRYGNAYKFVHGEAEAAMMAKVRKCVDSCQANMMRLAEWDPAQGSPAENAAWHAAYIEIATMVEQYCGDSATRLRQVGVPV